MLRGKQFDPETELKGNQIRCRACQTFKPKREFSRCASTALGYLYKCKKCYASHPDFRKKYVVRHRRQTLAKYGLTPEGYETLLVKQHGVCAICHQPEIDQDTRITAGRVAPITKQLSVDHCHRTGKVRGLLCNRCNTAIGLFYEKIERLLSAAEYLTRSANT